MKLIINEFGAYLSKKENRFVVGSKLKLTLINEERLSYSEQMDLKN